MNTVANHVCELERRLPAWVFQHPRFKGDVSSYRNAMRDGLYECAVVELAALAGTLEFDGHRIPEEFWRQLTQLADDFDVGMDLDSLRKRGGWKYHHKS